MVWQRFVIGSLAGLSALAVMIFMILSPPAARPPLPSPSAEPIFAWVLGLLGVLAVSSIGIAVWRRRKRAKPEPPFPLPSSLEPAPYSAPDGDDISDRFGSYHPYEESPYGESDNSYAPKSIEEEIADAVEKEILRRQKSRS